MKLKSQCNDDSDSLSLFLAIIIWVRGRRTGTPGTALTEEETIIILNIVCLANLLSALPPGYMSLSLYIYVCI